MNIYIHTYLLKCTLHMYKNKGETRSGLNIRSKPISKSSKDFGN